MLTDFFRTLGFLPLRYDQDVWMRLCDDLSGYAYICTHVDAFKVINTTPKIFIEHISVAFLDKSHESCAYYLGNNYQYHYGKGKWTYGTKTYNQ